MKNKVTILETTLRDGSYTINYQFNANETRIISKILDEIGFEYIEIGAGTGFNTESASEFKPASTDEEYIKAAKEVVTNGKVGMFFIPGIGRMDDIDIAGKNGLDLIRIGTNIDEFQQGFKFLNHCKKYNIETAANLMKSYAVSPKEFGRIADECHKNGADMVYLVDSSGGMLPQDIKAFVTEAKSINPNVKIGFHGHDNLGLAIPNTIAAIDSGADIVDSSIRGMGRSSGNTITEKLILVLKRLGHSMNYDMDKLFELSQNIIMPYLDGKPESTLDIIFGYSQFHSSYYGLIQKYADKYGVDPKDLIVAYTRIDKLSIDEEQLEKLAEKLSANKKQSYHYKIDSNILIEDSFEEQIDSIGQEMIETRHKFNRKTFFNVTKVYDDTVQKISPIVHYDNKIAFGSAEVRDKTAFKKIEKRLKEKVDGFLVDSRLGIKGDRSSTKTIFFYNDARLHAQTICNYILSIFQINQETGLVFIDERDEIKAFLEEGLQSLNLEIAHSIKEADIAVIGTKTYALKEFNSKTLKWVIVSKPGTISPDLTKNRGRLNLIRLDLEHEIFSEIRKNLNYHVLLNKKYGVCSQGHEKYCSGGYIGSKGTMVVDNINHITKFYGVSNGDGSISYNMTKASEHNEKQSL